LKKKGFLEKSLLFQPSNEILPLKTSHGYWRLGFWRLANHYLEDDCTLPKGISQPVSRSWFVL